jgi:hypothetical protein
MPEFRPWLSFLVPRGPEPHRDRAWEWVRERIMLTVPVAEVVEGAPDRVGDQGQFNEPQALNRAAERASGAVFALLDADTAFDRGALLRAAQRVLAGEIPWAMPRHYLRLTREMTRRVLTWPCSTNLRRIDDVWEVEWAGVDHMSFSAMIVRQESFELVNGVDERYTGWGFRDRSFHSAMNTLVGPVSRYNGRVYHLWHPQPLAHHHGQPMFEKQKERFALYEQAEGDKQAMRALVSGNRPAKVG